MSETILNNARLVLADEVRAGSVQIVDGRIAAIEGASSAGLDLGGDYLLPGFVELHTDALEFHYKPRPRVRWSPDASIQQHDAQVAASGITTVFDALRVGLDQENDMGRDDMVTLGAAIERASEADDCAWTISSICAAKCRRPIASRVSSCCASIRR